VLTVARKKQEAGENFITRSSIIYTLSNIIRVIKSGRRRWAGHVAYMGDIQMYTKLYSLNLKGRDNLGDLGVDGTMHLREIWCEGVEWIFLARDRT
jgi:hypothetical protein